MFRYAVLGSGSSANSYIFEYENFSFILDNGFSARELNRRMKELSFHPQNLQFIFLSHIHSDHLKGVETLSRERQVPVVIHENLNINEFVNRDVFHKLSVIPNRSYNYKKLDFTPFATSHDAPSSLSYFFKIGGMKITIITDTGVTDDNMFNLALQSDILLLESNYSEDMLENGKYPGFLKRRISSEVGHLSNFQSAFFLEKLRSHPQCRIRQIYLCHLSKNNNSLSVADKEIQSIYRGSIPYRICDRGELVNGVDPGSF
ncbi:MAG: MBL fold metallo-hydrolase [Spirochaetaceae bacterium]|nr:MBL fold metallo-hydrolase [Spirochaetaceae bacterium]